VVAGSLLSCSDQLSYPDWPDEIVDVTIALLTAD